ncbi:MAG: type II toxin-antitoxin system RelE/ParE family toxin [Actinobacteria bacterium]|nr:type II toxin-antitoxin system RelE/ParE family toxin [Actinomycetota bacterium]
MGLPPSGRGQARAKAPPSGSSIGEKGGRSLSSGAPRVRTEWRPTPDRSLRSARRGDYRIIYEIFEDEQVALIHRVQHRRGVYRPR